MIIMDHIIKLIKKALKSKDPRVLAGITIKIIDHIAPRDLRQLKTYLWELKESIEILLESLEVMEYGDCS